MNETWTDLDDSTPPLLAAGILLDQWRRWEGYTLRDIAGRLGCTPMTVCRWCCGRRPAEDYYYSLRGILPEDIFDALAADWWGYTVSPVEMAIADWWLNRPERIKLARAVFGEVTP